MEVGPEGFEPSTHGLRVRPGWSENRPSAPADGNFPKTVSHMLPKEVDFPAQTGPSTARLLPPEISGFNVIRLPSERYR